MINFRFSLFLFSLLFLNACSGNQKLESVFAPDAKLKDNSTNLITQEKPPIETEKTLPIEIPVYASAKLSKTQDNKFTFISTDSINLIKDFYQQELTAKNWVILPQENSDFIAKNSANQEVKISFKALANQTEFIIEYPFIADNIVTKPELNNTNNNQENIVTNPDLTNTNNQVNTVNNKPENNLPNNQSNSPLQDLIALNIIDSTQKLDTTKPITRRQYAKWLVTANNVFHKNSPSLQIRLADQNSTPIFSDVKNNDPDFAEIQGLAEAGLIPSTLTKNTNASAFKPDLPLIREDLIAWKVPLDVRQALPNASLDSIKETWGFQDASQINPQSWSFLYVDWQNGDRANVKRVFGYTRLFQPKKVVSYEEVAIILSYFGDLNNGIFAQDLLTELTKNIP